MILQHRNFYTCIHLLHQVSDTEHPHDTGRHHVLAAGRQLGSFHQSSRGRRPLRSRAGTLLRDTLDVRLRRQPPLHDAHLHGETHSVHGPADRLRKGCSKHVHAFPPFLYV